MEGFPAARAPPTLRVCSCRVVCARGARRRSAVPSSSGSVRVAPMDHPGAGSYDRLSGPGILRPDSRAGQNRRGGTRCIEVGSGDAAAHSSAAGRRCATGKRSTGVQRGRGQPLGRRHGPSTSSGDGRLRHPAAARTPRPAGPRCPVRWPTSPRPAGPRRPLQRPAVACPSGPHWPVQPPALACPAARVALFSSSRWPVQRRPLPPLEPPQAIAPMPRILGHPAPSPPPAGGAGHGWVRAAAGLVALPACRRAGGASCGCAPRRQTADLVARARGAWEVPRAGCGEPPSPARESAVWGKFAAPGAAKPTSACRGWPRQWRFTVAAVQRTQADSGSRSNEAHPPSSASPTAMAPPRIRTHRSWRPAADRSER